MRSFKQTGWMLVAIVSLALNAALAYSLYQNSQAPPIDASHKQTTAPVPVDYESFKTEWGSAWVGLTVSNVTPAMAARAMLDRPEGAYVNRVVTGSPAQKADIETGNILLSFNGRKIRDAMQFQSDLAGAEVGDEIYLCVSKNDYRITVYVVPEARPAGLPAPVKSFPFLGVTVQDAAADGLAVQQLEDAEKEGGVKVESVVAGSPAEKAGVLAGDVIMSFNSRKTRTLREFLTDLAACQPGQTVRICIVREDIRKTLNITLAQYFI